MACCEPYSLRPDCSRLGRSAAEHLASGGRATPFYIVGGVCSPIRAARSGCRHVCKNSCHVVPADARCLGILLRTVTRRRRARNWAGRVGLPECGPQPRHIHPVTYQPPPEPSCNNLAEGVAV